MTVEARQGNAVRLNLLNGLALALISGSVIAFQIILMRMLSVTRYHHFSYLVISTALLGFGMSGTVLSFSGEKLRKHFAVCYPVLVVLFAVSIPLSTMLSGALPIDTQYLLYSAAQVLLVVVHALLLLVPFLLGGLMIGLALLQFEDSVPAVYGINLFGSGAGGLGAVGLLSAFSPFALPAFLSAAALLSLLLWLLSSGQYVSGRYRSLSAGMIMTGAILAAGLLMVRPDAAVDHYKMLAHLERLARQGTAEHVARKFSPRGQIDVYASKHLHQTLFSGPQGEVLPPEQLAILVDGNYAAGIFAISHQDDARILDFTPQSLPYRMVDAPRVLLLGEVGGVNVWLAKRFGASGITVVQGNGQLNDLLLQDLADRSGNVLRLSGVQVITREPHLYIAQSREVFDIIHLVAAEGMAAGVSGLQSLHEDYLLTVESLARCLARLSDRGVISLTRGIQTPPRDNLRVFGLFAAALDYAGERDAGTRLFQGRNYLAVNTMMWKQPPSETAVGRYRELTRDLLMDTEYYPGISSSEMNQINAIEGPPGRPYSYLHAGAMKMLSEERADFYRRWAYHVSPPTNDRPYFYDFFKLESVRRMIHATGGHWIQRLELGYVILVVSCIGIVASAVVFIVLPLFWLKTGLRSSGGRVPVLLYFLSLGFGFMFVEMVFIQKFTMFVGDPVSAVSIALTSILVFAGTGSLFQKRMRRGLVQRVKICSVIIFLLIISYIVFSDKILEIFSGLGLPGRFAVTALLIAPVSFFMGWMFPCGLAMLERGRASYVPWAWGINGFASVSAAPMSVMLSMTFGFRFVLIVAAVLYLVAGWVAAGMDRSVRTVPA